MVTADVEVYLYPSLEMVMVRKEIHVKTLKAKGYVDELSFSST